MYYIKLDENKKHLFDHTAMDAFEEGRMYVSKDEEYFVESKDEAHLYESIGAAESAISSEWEIVEKA